MHFNLALHLTFQNNGTTLTLSGQALAGVAITSQSVLLSGDLVLDVSGLDAYDGMTFVLINATNITGQWQSVDAEQTTNDCYVYNTYVTYTSQAVTVEISEETFCEDEAIEMKVAIGLITLI